MKTMLRALAFAAETHQGNELTSAIAMANLLANEAGVEDEKVMVCAILHMTQSAPSSREMERLFGQEVRDILASLSPGALADEESIPQLPRRARLVLLAEKICRLRELVANPRKLWPLEQRQAAFDEARQTTALLHGVHPQLERLFDEVHKLRPRLQVETAPLRSVTG